MKTFEFTEEQIKMLAKCMEHRQGWLERSNRILQQAKLSYMSSDERIAEYNKNREESLCLQTLLNYINS